MASSGKFDGFPSAEFMTRFRTQALDFKESRGPELLERLESHPGGLECVLIWVKLHIGSEVESETRNVIRARTSSLRQRAKTFARFERDLILMAKRAADEINPHLDASYFVPNLSLQLVEAMRFQEEMRSQAARLAIVRASVSKEARDTSPRWEKMNAIHMLSQLLTTEQGEPDCGAIATLLEIGYSAFGTRKDITIHDVKKLVKRAQDQMAKRSAVADRQFERIPQRHPKRPQRPPHCVIEGVPL